GNARVHRARARGGDSPTAHTRPVVGEGRARASAGLRRGDRSPVSSHRTRPGAPHPLVREHGGCGSIQRALGGPAASSRPAGAPSADEPRPRPAPRPAGAPPGRGARRSFPRLPRGRMAPRAWLEARGRSHRRGAEVVADAPAVSLWSFRVDEAGQKRAGPAEASPESVTWRVVS